MKIKLKVYCFAIMLNRFYDLHEIKNKKKRKKQNRRKEE